MAIRPSRRRVLSALGVAGVPTMMPRPSQGQSIGQLFETLERLERAVDQQVDAEMRAPYGTPAYDQASEECARLQVRRDAAFRAVAAAPATTRRDIERKLAIFRAYTSEAYHQGEQWILMIDSALNDFRALR